MSDLEKYIIENRDGFSSDEPGSGHAARFADRLKTGKRPARKLQFRHVMQIAASLAIIIASGVVIVKSNQGSGKTAAAEVPEEYQETYDYYVTQVKSRYDEISAFSFTEEEQRKMLMDELSEMDRYHKELLEELNATPDDERVINALIRHYQLKVSVMDRIIDQLNQIQKHKTQNDESKRI